MLKSKGIKVFLLGILLSFMSLGLSTRVQAQTLDSHLYAPFVNFINYSFAGEGNEFAPMDITLQYGPNSQGIYQFSINNGGTEVVYVYQLADQGVVELAYFPETYTADDLRSHADVLDSQKSLVLPRELSIGTAYSRGYRQEQDFTVIDIIDRLDWMDTIYYDVVVVEGVDDDGYRQTFYYAAGVGLIYELWQDSEGFEVTRTLEHFNGSSSHFIKLINN